MKQITIIVNDKVGVLADISHIMGKARMNIESLTAEVHDNKGIVRLVVKDEKRATKMLESNGYNILSSEMVIVKVKDGPGELSKVSKMLGRAGINIENLYLVSKTKNHTINAMKVDKVKKARRLLSDFIVKPK